MPIKIQKDYVFESAVHFEDKFLINFYEITLNMHVITDDMREQNIAIERVNYFIAEQLDHHLWISETETKAIENYKNAGIPLLIIPEEPFDQVVGMILLLKFNAIMEGKVHVTDIIFGSKLTNQIKFNTFDEEAEALFNGKFWWTDSNNTTHHTKATSKKDKVVKLFNAENWHDLGLTWEEPK
jgi:hypothetical protein